MTSFFFIVDPIAHIFTKVILLIYDFCEIKALTAINPLTPITPPPGCCPLPHKKRPLMGVSGKLHLLVRIGRRKKI